MLRHIPVVRYLFSNETTILRETELYLFLRPVWTAPVLPALDGMQGDKAQQVPLVQELLRANPNLAIGAEDAALLGASLTPWRSNREPAKPPRNLDSRQRGRRRGNHGRLAAFS